MPRSYARIILHTVFCTKYRKPFIHPDIEDDLYGVIGNEFKKKNCTIIRINGVFDHVHILHTLSRSYALADIVQEAKARSSRWAKKQGMRYQYFQWQNGYSTHSADYRNLDNLVRYIDNQKQHHYGNSDGTLIRETFAQEYEKLLTAFGFPFDPELELPIEPQK